MEYPSSCQTFGNQYYEKTKQRKQPPKLQHHQTESAKVRNRVWFRTGPNSKSTNQERPQNISILCKHIIPETHSHTCKGPHVASYKGCPAYKKQAFRQHVVDNQKSYASILRQNLAPPQPKDKAFTFSADQLVKFVANVVIQVAQPQVCYANPTQDAIDKKSSLC